MSFNGSQLTQFGIKDLQQLLPDEQDAFSLKHTNLNDTDKLESLKPRIDQSKKVARYFKGKAPVWANDGKEDADIRIDSSSSRINDSRLARLEMASINRDNSDNKGSSRRRIYEAEVIEEGVSEEDDNDKDWEKSIMLGDNDDEDDNEDEQIIINNNNDEDDIDARRARIYKRLAVQKENDLEIDIVTHNRNKFNRVIAEAEIINNEEEVEEEESEYETDSDESEKEEKIKHVFIPKSQRKELQLMELKNEEEELKLIKKQENLEIRKEVSRNMVAVSIRREEERKHALDNTDVDSDSGLPDDTDNVDEELEFENWKIREMMRLKRDAEIREKIVLEKADLLRRRNMTDEERINEDKKLGRFDKKEKSKWNYMQKYYHKGVFYMDDENATADDVRNRDYSGPTLEDNYNKEAMPSVLQVKNFGKRGRTKYTHLVDQDTTFGDQRKNFNKDNNKLEPSENLPKPLPLRKHEGISNNYYKKVSGVGDLDNAGRLHKRQKE